VDHINGRTVRVRAATLPAAILTTRRALTSYTQVVLFRNGASLSPPPVTRLGSPHGLVRACVRACVRTYVRDTRNSRDIAHRYGTARGALTDRPINQLTNEPAAATHHRPAPPSSIESTLRRLRRASRWVGGQLR